MKIIKETVDVNFTATKITLKKYLKNAVDILKLNNVFLSYS